MGLGSLDLNQRSRVMRKGRCWQQCVSQLNDENALLRARIVARNLL